MAFKMPFRYTTDNKNSSESDSDCSKSMIKKSSDTPRFYPTATTTTSKFDDYYNVVGGVGGGSTSRSNSKNRLTKKPSTGIIEEEPTSIDSIISNPASFPITIVPSSSLIRSSTQASMGKYSRQSSTR